MFLVWNLKTAVFKCLQAFLVLFDFVSRFIDVKSADEIAANQATHDIDTLSASSTLAATVTDDVIAIIPKQICEYLRKLDTQYHFPSRDVISFGTVCPFDI